MFTQDTEFGGSIVRIGSGEAKSDRRVPLQRAGQTDATLLIWDARARKSRDAKRRFKPNPTIK